MAEQKDKETDAVEGQFKRNLDHILIGNGDGPEITVGKIKLKFRRKAPVRALAVLVNSDNQVNGMIQYIQMSLKKGQEAAFEQLIDDIDISGLSEILEALGEGYTSFPVAS